MKFVIWHQLFTCRCTLNPAWFCNISHMSDPASFLTLVPEEKSKMARFVLAPSDTEINQTNMERCLHNPLWADGSLQNEEFSSDSLKFSTKSTARQMGNLIPSVAPLAQDALFELARMMYFCFSLTAYKIAKRFSREPLEAASTKFIWVLQPTR